MGYPFPYAFLLNDLINLFDGKPIIFVLFTIKKNGIMQKKYVLILSVLLVLTSASVLFAVRASAHSSAATAVVDATSKDKKNQVKPTKITAAQLRSLIYDYKASPEKWVFKGDKPVIIDFYADWCGPCRQIAPVLDQLAEEYKDQIIIYKVDVDKEKELAGVFGISSIPALLFVPVKEEPRMHTGALPKKAMVKQIEKVLLKK